jgi:eukaryotic-like serine/threonine-protein kinase
VLSANGVVKLIDFGIAKTRGSHTQIGVIKGKLGYIAPEYIEGRLDHRADLWAVGVMAYELLTGKRLFVADSDFETLRMIRTAAIEPPSHRNPDVPGELDAIVMTALERDPARRWQNAHALRNALAGVAVPSSNAAVVEWFEWMQALSPEDVLRIRMARPARLSGQRPGKEAPPFVDIGLAPPVAAHDAPTIALCAHVPQLPIPQLRIAPSSPVLPAPMLRRVPSASWSSLPPPAPPSSSPLTLARAAPPRTSPAAVAATAPPRSLCTTMLGAGAVPPPARPSGVAAPRRDRYQEALHAAPPAQGAHRATAKLVRRAAWSPWLVGALACLAIAACSAVGIALA